MLIHDEAKRVGRFHFWPKKLLSASLHVVRSFLAISNMDAILTESRIVALEGLKTKFMITKDEDIVHIAEKVFVRLSPTSHTFIALVAEKNPLVPSPLPKGFTLSTSRGLLRIMQLRNTAQAGTMSEHEGTDCNLFDDDVEIKHAQKKPRHSRAAIKSLKEERSMLTIDLEHGDKTVTVGLVRPIHPTDNLFVLYDAEVLGCVLNVIREGGFETKELRILPKGVYFRKGKMVAMAKKANGNTVWKTCDTIEEAVVFQSTDHDAEAHQEVQAALQDAPSAAAEESEDH